MESPVHPFHPPSLELADYVPQQHSVFSVLLTVAIVTVVTNLLSQKAIARYNPTASVSDRLRAVWFTCCLATHSLMEPHYVFNYDGLRSSTSLISSMWKFYARCDSRYMFFSQQIWDAEVVTVFIIAPFCWLALVGIVRRNLTYDIIGSIASSAMYLCTISVYYYDALPGKYSRPEAIYYWGFFVALNAPWAIVPVILLWDAAQRLDEKLALANHAEKQVPKVIVTRPTW